MNGRGLLSLGFFLYLSCTTHAQLSKAAKGLNAKFAVLSDLVSGYGGNFFSAGVFYWD